MLRANTATARQRAAHTHLCDTAVCAQARVCCIVLRLDASRGRAASLRKILRVASRGRTWSGETTSSGSAPLSISIDMMNCICDRSGAVGARLPVATRRCSAVVTLQRGWTSARNESPRQTVRHGRWRSAASRAVQANAKHAQVGPAARMWASRGADVGESRRRCGRVAAQMWASRGADVGALG
jgi:hypothetical protein